MKKKFVEYNGVCVASSWPARIQKAQLHSTYLIGGVDRQRVRYGDEAEGWGADKHPCHDCAVIKGQYHVAGCMLKGVPLAVVRRFPAVVNTTATVTGSRFPASLYQEVRQCSPHNL